MDKYINADKKETNKRERMKIYQLYVYGGEYEDCFFRIVGSYLRKEKAEEVKLKMEAEEKELKKQEERCAACPFLMGEIHKLEEFRGEWYDFCSEIKLEEFDGSIYCSSPCFNREELTFEIKEIEIEE